MTFSEDIDEETTKAHLSHGEESQTVLRATHAAEMHRLQPDMFQATGQERERVKGDQDLF